jgi:hypothetical protein
MTGEAQILANRRNAGNSPRRHRDRGDDPQFAEEHGSDFILGALCVSVVKNSREGRAESDLIVQNKANFQGGRMDPNGLTGNGLWEFFPVIRP